MQSYSQAFHNAISASTRDIRGYIKFNGTFVLDGEGGLISFKTTQTAMEAERFCVGSVCSAMCEATFFNEGLEGSGVSLANSYFDAYIGVVTDPDNNTTEYVCVGRFYVSEISRSTATTRIVGYDIAGRLSMDYAPTVTAGSNGYLAMDILNDIIDQTGVNGGQHFTTYGSTTYVPTLYEGTCRAQWGWLCSLIDGTASNYSGSREESTLGYMKGYVVGNSAANPYAIDDSTTYMDGLSVGDEFTVTSFTSGTTEEPIVVGNGTGIYGLNPYMTQSVATTIEGTVDGYDYYPVTLHWRGDPCLDLMDELSVTSGENTYIVVAMKIETTFNGGLEQTINCWGDSEEYYAMSTSPTQGAINRVSSLVQEIQQAIETADGGVITKILDTDGTWKELVIANNQDLDQATSVWRFNINGLAHSNRYQGGTYTLAMDTQGRIVANVIQTGILQDAQGNNSWNLDTGAFTITNGSIHITTSNDEEDIIQLNYDGRLPSGYGSVYSTSFQSKSIRADGHAYQPSNIHYGSQVVMFGNGHGEYVSVEHDIYSREQIGSIYGKTKSLFLSNGISTTEAIGIGASEVERMRLNCVTGLHFFDSSGNLTALYPATGLPMLSAATAVDSNSYTGKVINVGQVPRADLGLTTSATVPDVITAWLKYICTRYPNATDCIFDGIAFVGSRRMIRCYVYDTSSVSGGLPQYSAGELLSYDSTRWYFRTYEYSINAYQLADYVVERGTINGWTYRKWKSGAYECWRTVAPSIAINSAWGSNYYGALSAYDYPVTFSERPYEQVTVRAGSGWAWIVGGTTISTTSKTGAYYLMRSASAASQQYYIDYYVRGYVSS